MAEGSAIEWTDITWNFVTGCTKISDGCVNCYIEKTLPFRVERRRFNQPGIGGSTGVKLHSDRLHWPLTKWKKPARIFVNSLADIFHEDVPDQFIAEAFAVMSLAPHHTFQVLTKRHARMRALLNSGLFWTMVNAALYQRAKPVLPGSAPHALPNVHIGVSVENQHWADIRIPALLDTPAPVRWLSCEPLLGPVDLSRWLGPVDWPECWNDHAPSTECSRCIQPNWIVVGGESGLGARPMHPDWPRRLRDQAVAAGVPYFFKQWGQYGVVPKKRPDGLYDMNDPGVAVANDGTVYQPGELAYPDGPRWGEALRAGHDKASLTAMYRVGKKEAGRELDDKTWDEFPRQPEQVTA